MKKQMFLLMLVACLGAGCKDLFETDISEKAVSVQGPKYGAWVTPGEVTFVWYELKGADEYRVMVASPNFDTPVRILVDTVVEGSYFGMTLQEGDYAWSIQPRNFGYNGIRQTYLLHVGTEPEEPQEPEETEYPAPEEEDDGEGNDGGNGGEDHETLNE